MNSGMLTRIRQRRERYSCTKAGSGRRTSGLSENGRPGILSNPAGEGVHLEAMRADQKEVVSRSPDEASANPELRVGCFPFHPSFFNVWSVASFCGYLRHRGIGDSVTIFFNFAGASPPPAEAI